MGDGEETLRKTYGRHLPGLVVLTFAIALALDLAVGRAPVERALLLATGVAVGQLVAAVVIRRRLRR